MTPAAITTAAIAFPDIRPEIFTIALGGFEFSLRWYALAYIAGLLLGWWIVATLMKRPALWGGRAPMTAAQVEDLLTAAVIGVILGGRLGFVLFYQPGYYLANPLDILKVWEGGMSFHGGFLGVVIAAFWFAWRHAIDRRQLADALAMATPAGLFFGRLANFINAELWGRPTTGWYGVIFPGEAAQFCPGFDLPCARHPSQLYEAGLEGLALGLILLLMLRAGALLRPGLTLGVFLTGYGLARFAVEFVRQADMQFITADNPLGHALRLGEMGLSMGQLLSLPMIAAGLWFIASARRKAT